MKIKVSYVCDRGTKRKKNEDAILIHKKILTETKGKLEICPNGGILFAVADGMGGFMHGEIASMIVLKTLSQNDIHTKEDIRSALISANENLQTYSEKNLESQEIGSVVAGIYINGGYACVFNIGDCRVYRKRGQYLNQVSKDTSVVGKLIEMGVISYEEVRTHPERSVLTSTLSSKSHKYSLEINLREIELNEEEVFLICSDGLWDVLTENEMEEILFNEEYIDKVAVLLQKTLEKGDKDNISIILLEVIQ